MTELPDDVRVSTSRDDETRVDVGTETRYLDYEQALALADTVATTAEESKAEEDL